MCIRDRNQSDYSQSSPQQYLSYMKQTTRSAAFTPLGTMTVANDASATIPDAVTMETKRAPIMAPVENIAPEHPPADGPDDPTYDGPEIPVEHEAAPEDGNPRPWRFEWEQSNPSRAQKERKKRHFAAMHDRSAKMLAHADEIMRKAVENATRLRAEAYDAMTAAGDSETDTTTEDEDGDEYVMPPLEPDTESEDEEEDPEPGAEDPPPPEDDLRAAELPAAPAVLQWREPGDSTLRSREPIQKDDADDLLALRADIAVDLAHVLDEIHLDPDAQPTIYTLVENIHRLHEAQAPYKSRSLDPDLAQVGNRLVRVLTRSIVNIHDHAVVHLLVEREHRVFLAETGLAAQAPVPPTAPTTRSRSIAGAPGGGPPDPESSDDEDEDAGGYGNAPDGTPPNDTPPDGAPPSGSPPPGPPSGGPPSGGPPNGGGSSRTKSSGSSRPPPGGGGPPSGGPPDGGPPPPGHPAVLKRGIMKNHYLSLKMNEQS